MNTSRFSPSCLLSYNTLAFLLSYATSVVVAVDFHYAPIVQEAQMFTRSALDIQMYAERVLVLSPSPGASR